MDTSKSALALSIATAVRLSGIGRTTIYAAIKNGELPARKCGRRTVIMSSELEAWLRNLPRVAALRVTGEPRGDAANETKK